jgi:hypothetical protein
MKTTIKTKDIDKGYKRIKRSLDKLKGSYVTIGVHENAGTYPEGKPTVGEVAFWNEYGTRNIPARPFLRFTMTQKYREFVRKTKEYFLDVIAGVLGERAALDTLGFRIASEIQNSIKKAMIWATPLADSTVRRKMKGSEKEHVVKGKSVSVKILIDSGLLLRSIGFKSYIKNIVGQYQENPQGE